MGMYMNSGFNIDLNALAYHRELSPIRSSLGLCFIIKKIDGSLLHFNDILPHIDLRMLVIFEEVTDRHKIYCDDFFIYSISLSSSIYSWKQRNCYYQKCHSTSIRWPTSIQRGQSCKCKRNTDNINIKFLERLTTQPSCHVNVCRTTAALISMGL